MRAAEASPFVLREVMLEIDGHAVLVEVPDGIGVSTQPRLGFATLVVVSDGAHGATFRVTDLALCCALARGPMELRNMVQAKLDVAVDVLTSVRAL